MKKRIVFVALLLLVVLAFTACNTYTYDNASAYRAASGELTLEADKVEKLDVDWVTGSVTIETWEEETICVSETAQVSLSTGDRLHYYLDGKTLRIRYMQESVLSADLIKKDLLIRIPADLALTELSLDMDSADADIDGIHCKRYELESVSGDLSVTATSSVQLLEIDTVSGSSELSFATLSHFEIDSVSGGVTLSCLTAPGDGEIATVSGTINLALKEDSNFTIEYKTNSGELTSELPVTMTDGRYVYGTGESRYQFETVSANIHIKKIEEAS